VRRAIRILINAATLLSLACCVIIVALWARSYFREDVIDLGGGATDLNAGMSAPERGRLLDLRNGLVVIRRYAWRNPGGQFHAIGGGMIVLPYPLLVLLTAVLPGFRMAAWYRRRRRRRSGHCPTCNYDLRATPDRCPECGAVPTAKDARLPGPGG